MAKEKKCMHCHSYLQKKKSNKEKLTNLGILNEFKNCVKAL